MSQRQVKFKDKMLNLVGPQLKAGDSAPDFACVTGLDIVKLGDEIWVKCVGIDEKGRVKLSRKAAMEERDREMSGKGEGKPEKAAAQGEGPSPKAEARA